MFACAYGPVSTSLVRVHMQVGLSSFSTPFLPSKRKKGGKNVFVCAITRARLLLCVHVDCTSVYFMEALFLFLGFLSKFGECVHSSPGLRFMQTQEHVSPTNTEEGIQRMFKITKTFSERRSLTFFSHEVRAHLHAAETITERALISFYIGKHVHVCAAHIFLKREVPAFLSVLQYSRSTCTCLTVLGDCRSRAQGMMRPLR